MRRKPTWKCQRVSLGRKCGHENLNRFQICEHCGRRRPARKVPEHRAVLKTMTYEDWVEMNGGEQCGICGAPPKNVRLNRDHEHKGNGRARGLLCPLCNKRLHAAMDLAWLKAAVAYLERDLARSG